MLQVIDFGSSCYENQRVYTYIQSRFYRAPEVILGAKYGMPIDMWSLGCILAELLTGCALFPGEDENDQLACIIELLGMPPQKLLDQSKRAKNFFSAKGYPRYCLAETLEDGHVVLRSGTSRQGKERGPPGSKSLKKALKGCDDPLFLNFLCGCLEWDPELRMTPAAALKHSWFRRRLPRLPQQLQANANATLDTASTVSPPTNKDANTTTLSDTASAINANVVTSNESGCSGSINSIDATLTNSIVDKRSCTTQILNSLHAKNRNSIQIVNSNLVNANVATDSSAGIVKTENGTSNSNTNNASNVSNGTCSAIIGTNKLRVLLQTNDVNSSTLRPSAKLSPIPSITNSTKNLSSIQQPLSPPINTSVSNHIATSTQ